MRNMRMMVIFEKGAPLRHIGHLDLMRAMQRALRRSSLPITYSKGFNPHVQLSFASPLGVGIVGLREVMDVPLEEAVEEERFVSRLNQALPACLRIRRARILEDDFPTLMALVSASRYTIYLEPSENVQAVMGKVTDFMALDTYSALRKTKSGEAMCDIRPFVISADVACKGDERAIHCTLKATSAGTLKPSLWVKCLCEMADVKMEGIQFLWVRENILCSDQNGALVAMEDYSHAR